MPVPAPVISTLRPVVLIFVQQLVEELPRRRVVDGGEPGDQPDRLRARHGVLGLPSWMRGVARMSGGAVR
jgi:hypothetical protein